MARRTKTETEQTRLQIIAAARKVFAARGVSRTTLAQIAKEADVTRGAIYWHFKNKPDLFFAMLEQVSLPLIDHLTENLPDDNPGDPLRGVHASMSEVLRLLTDDPIARTTFEIVVLKCEYVDEFAPLARRVNQTGCAFVQKMMGAYAAAKHKGLLREDADPAACALDSFIFLKGMMRVWLSDTDGVIIRGKAQTLIDAHIALRYKP